MTILALVLGLMSTACSDDSDSQGPTADGTATTTTARPATSAPDTSPTTIETTPSTTPATPEAEVEAAYLKIMSSFFEGLQAPNPDDPAVKGFHSGAHLTYVTQLTRDLADASQRAAPGPSGHWPVPIVMSVKVEGDTAEAIVCIVDDSRIVDVESGAVINDEISTKESRAIFIRRGKRWLLDSQLLRQRQLGIKDCPNTDTA